jgi:hypothetical protein
MKKLKRISAAIVAAAVTAASFAGCSSTDYAMTVDGEKVNAGVYINFLLNEMTNQMYMLYYSGDITEVSECFDQEIDGKDFSTYVKDEALESTKECAVIAAKFDEFKLSLSDDDASTVSDSIDSTWSDSSDFYEKEGISKDSLTQCTQNSYKRSAIFDYYYDEGGIEEVSSDDLQSYVNENYLRYKTVTISKSTEEDEDTANTENEELKALAEQYLAEAENLDFDGFDTVIDEYAAYQEALTAEEEETTDDSTTDDTSTDETTEDTSTEDSTADESTADESEADDTATDESTADESSAEDSATDESAADESSEDESTADESVTDESTADSESDTDSDTDSSTEDTETATEDTDSEDEEEEDPYANETVTKYTDVIDSESDSYDEDTAEMYNTFKDAEYGKAGMYEDDYAYYVYITADVADRTDYVSDNKDSLLQEIKGDEFDELIDSWVDDAKIEVNDKAIKRYSVQEAYDRQEEYYSSES